MFDYNEAETLIAGKEKPKTVDNIAEQIEQKSELPAEKPKPEEKKEPEPKTEKLAEKPEAKAEEIKVQEEAAKAEREKKPEPKKKFKEVYQKAQEPIAKVAPPEAEKPEPPPDWRTDPEARKFIASSISKIKSITTQGLSEEQKIRLWCSEQGITDEEKIQREIDGVEVMTPTHQKNYFNGIDAHFDKKRNEEIGELIGQPDQIKENTNKLFTDIAAIKTKVEGSEINGVLADSESLLRTQKLIDDSFNFQNQDQSLNAKKMFDAAFLIANFSQIQESIAEKWYNEGVLSQLKEDHRISENSTEMNHEMTGAKPVLEGHAFADAVIKPN